MSDYLDETLKHQLQYALAADINLKLYDLQGDVVEREAQLQGIVDTLSEKQHAEHLAKKIPGIKKVDNAIAISTDGDINDTSVEFEVGEELKADSVVNLKNIGVRSKKGVAALLGKTENSEELAAARRTAAKARGVKKVVSEVRIIDHKTGLKEIFHHQVNNDHE